MEFPAGNNHTLTQTESIDLSVPTNLIECFSNNLEEPSESSLELEIQPKKIKFPTSSSPNSPSETQENDKPQRVKELSSPSSTRRLSFVSYSDLINEERLSELLGKSRQEGQEGDEEGCMEFMMASSLEN